MVQRTPSSARLHATLALQLALIGGLSGVSLAGSSIALAEEPGGPATVLEHRVDVRIDSGKRLTKELVWTVRINDPEACAAGLLTPPGLDGAVDGEAMVLEDVLIVPSTAQSGDTFTLRATSRGDRGEHSGVFFSAPDLPIQHASLVVSTPGWSDLSVWADPGATPNYDISRRQRRVEMDWIDIPEGVSTSAAWSTFTDWDEAGATLKASVEGKLASKNALGRALAADLEGLGLAGVVERTYQNVSLIQGAPGDWRSARPALAVAKDGHGDAADRGVLLLSMLRIAGFQAEAGYFRPLQAQGGAPITVPAPALLPRPMIAVQRADDVVYIDPAAERAAVPARPASMLGATVWVPGSLPRTLPAQGVLDGEVNINSQVTISGDGGATWSVSVGSSGAATEYLRDLLAPLDEAGRTETLTRLVRQGRPEIERIQVTVSGAEKPNRPLKISVSGHDAGALQQVGFGLRGEVAPVLAPALAGWLPPNLVVRETLSITPPPALTILASARAPSAFRPEALVSRGYTRQGKKAVSSVIVERPHHASTPAMDTAASSFLREEARRGVDLLLFTPASRTTLKGLAAATSLGEVDKAVLTTLLWWSVNNDRRALKTLEKAMTAHGFDPLIAGVAHFAEPGDLRPWRALDQVGDADALRIEVVEGMVRAGIRHDAWLMAARLFNATDPEVRVRALLLAHRQQPYKQPAVEDDEEGHHAWREPNALLTAAAEAAATLPGVPSAGDPRVLARQAEQALGTGDATTAETLLDQIIEIEGISGPTLAMGALAAALNGLPADEVRGLITEAVGSNPKDPRVLALAASATAVVGDHEHALTYALTAARVANDDPRLWSMASLQAAAAGELQTALFAARRASDYQPSSKERARILTFLARLALSREDAQLGERRSGEAPAVGSWPISYAERVHDAAPDALLALLQYAPEVEEDPRQLAMRAQMRIDVGELDEAARDGVLLATKFNWPEGWALAFAATAGRQYSTTALDRLSKAARDQLTAQTTRMEYRLITGSGDPQVDARRLKGDPRAEGLLLTASRPAEALTKTEGWPTGTPTPSFRAPSGYRINRTLSAPAGVVAYANPHAAQAILVVGGVTGLLPPPLSLMYSLNPQPIQRLEGGGQVIRLDGGVIPLYGAVAIHDGQEIYGLGFTAQAAKRALSDALGR